ncbi:MAG: hypothetical protein LIP77_06080 [Planctomycetes bacterium]|nr:hypothetical protein [Planctomycetota bacterium]
MDETTRTPPRRVAVASAGGRLVDACFGRAASYQIYEWSEDGYRLTATRPGPSPCRNGGHDHDALAAAIDTVADCQVVLAGRIGPEALRLLALRGVRGLSTRIGIQDALDRLAGKPFLRMTE